MLKNIKLKAAFLLLITTFPVFSTEKAPNVPGWTLIAGGVSPSGGNVAYYGKDKSFKSSEKEISFIVQESDYRNGKLYGIVSLYNINILKSSCLDGYGSVIFKTISGKFLFDADYVTDGTSNASGIAETLCSQYIKNR